MRDGRRRTLSSPVGRSALGVTKKKSGGGRNVVTVVAVGGARKGTHRAVESAVWRAVVVADVDAAAAAATFWHPVRRKARFATHTRGPRRPSRVYIIINIVPGLGDRDHQDHPAVGVAGTRQRHGRSVGACFVLFARSSPVSPSVAVFVRLRYSNGVSTYGGTYASRAIATHRPINYSFGFTRTARVFSDRFPVRRPTRPVRSTFRVIVVGVCRAERL